MWTEKGSHRPRLGLTLSREWLVAPDLCSQPSFGQQAFLHLRERIFLLCSLETLQGRHLTQVRNPSQDGATDKPWVLPHVRL